MSAHFPEINGKYKWFPVLSGSNGIPTNVADVVELRTIAPTLNKTLPCTHIIFSDH